MNKLFKKYFPKVLILLSLAVIIFRLVDAHKDSNEIAKYKGEVNGKIVDYYKVGVDNVFLKYSYYVDGKVFYSTTKVPLFSRIADCEKTKECIGRKIIVFYSLKNPKKSMIDMDRKILSQQSLLQGTLLQAGNDELMESKK